MTKAATAALRTAAPADALCIGVLAMQVFLDTYATAGVDAPLAREVLAGYGPDAFAARLAEASRAFILAESEGRLVGFAELAQNRPCPADPSARVELVRLYVQQPFQRQGIGSALLGRAERESAQGGAAALWLTAWEGNTAALAFYRHCGWQDRGATQHLIEGQAYPNRILLKLLSQETP